MKCSDGRFIGSDGIGSISHGPWPKTKKLPAAIVERGTGVRVGLRPRPLPSPDRATSVHADFEGPVRKG